MAKNRKALTSLGFIVLPRGQRVVREGKGGGAPIAFNRCPTCGGMVLADAACVLCAVRKQKQVGGSGEGLSKEPKNGV